MGEQGGEWGEEMWCQLPLPSHDKGSLQCAPARRACEKRSGRFEGGVGRWQGRGVCIEMYMLSTEPAKNARLHGLALAKGRKSDERGVV